MVIVSTRYEKCVFHVDLEEEGYMKLPPGKLTSSLGNVSKLKKALYGLKQYLRTWFECFCATMVSHNLTQC